MDEDDTEFDFDCVFSVVDDIRPELGNEWTEVASNEQAIANPVSDQLNPSRTSDLSGLQWPFMLDEFANPVSELNSGQASEVSGLQPLSNCLNFMFDSPEDFYSDAKLVLANGEEVSFHRCILSARIPFFKIALAAAGKMQVSGTPKLELEDIAKDYEVGFNSVMTILEYVYKNTDRLPPKEISNCLDKDCEHVSCRPAVEFIVEVLYLASVFKITELVTQYQRCLLEIVEQIRKEDILAIIKVASICGKDCQNVLDRCTQIIAQSDVDIVSLKKSLPSQSQHIVKDIMVIRKQIGLETPEPEPRTLGIYKALDTDDFELVNLFREECVSKSLDDAYALHYAVAYCNVKTTMKLLDLNCVNVNRRNPRGYTAIHVASMRKEPELLMYLLTKEAIVSEKTSDGRTALQIAKQVTKEADSYIPTHGNPCPKGKLCIEILEEANRRDPPVEASPSLLLGADHELMRRLLSLENQVAMLQSIFPTEAQIAMSVGQMEGTYKFTEEDPNITIQEEHLSRLTALSRSVELVKCFFPRCGKYFDTLAFLDHLSDPVFTDEDTPTQQEQQKKRLVELQETLGGNTKMSSLAASSSSTLKSTARVKHSSKRPYCRR